MSSPLVLKLQFTANCETATKGIFYHLHVARVSNTEGHVGIAKVNPQVLEVQIQSNTTPAQTHRETSALTTITQPNQRLPNTRNKTLTLAAINQPKPKSIAIWKEIK
ncbi:hypothetical protein LOAG_10705 [Loa loa]|uniref:Uncharacterized protein n=1 Tax=Loa loa TaxID=7209 RepID=A0A1S0TPX1_LOALO|nr:hypothetical protein LOAG_10705 [Loa loa]EFO17792.1 hypothetical protein LOAG_10705 [Loa loa]